MEFHDDMTLGEIKKMMPDLVLIGGRCPCCTRMAKVYKRTIYRGMATSLITLYKESQKRFLHWSKIKEFDGPLGGNFALLRYWDLVEEGAEGNSWRITQKGIDFVSGEIDLPKHALIYDGEFLGLDDTETICINDAMGEDFDLTTLMNEVVIL